MKALTLHGKEDLRFEHVADARIEHPGDALVRVDICGLCGSDLHPFFGRESGCDAGTVQGHEFVGTVAETGKDVHSIRTGDRVISPFSTNCGSCSQCLAGLTSRCHRGQLFGWRSQDRGLHGAQAEAVRVPWADATLVHLPEDLTPTQGLFLGDILTTGFFGAQQAGTSPGGTVGIVGCGPVGLMAVASARTLGAERVIAFDPLEERRRLASQFGAEAFSPEELGEVREHTRGGLSSVVEAVGSPNAFKLAFELLRPGGTLAAVGVHTSDRFAFKPAEAYDKNLTLRVGRCPARHLIERALPVVRQHPLEQLVTHRLDLSQGPDAYRQFGARSEGWFKVLFEP